MYEVTCSQCGDGTNHPEPPLPQAWDGLCPACAIRGALEGRLPGRDEALAYLLSVADRVMGDGIAVMLLGQERRSPGEEVCSTTGSVFYSQN